MDYYVGDERERFEEVFSDEIEKMSKKVLWALYFLMVLIVSSWFTTTIGSTTFFGIFFKRYALHGFVVAFGLLFFFVWKRAFTEEKMFEDWKDGKYPDKSYDYRDYRPRSQ